MSQIHDPEIIESARKNLGGIFNELRGQGALWHRTSIEALHAILGSSGIKPNDGAFKDTYPQSEYSYGRRFGAVSLFDFDTEPVERVLWEEHKWGQFLVDRGELTVLIRLDRGLLSGDGRLKLPADIAASPGPMIDYPDGKAPAYVMPVVEAFYHGIVPVAAFKGYLAVKPNSGYQYRSIAADADALLRMEELRAQWRSEIVQSPFIELLTRLEQQS
jgi:hypothetical protein